MHTFINTKKTIRVSNDFWDVTTAEGMAGIVAANLGDGRHLTEPGGHEFVNMSSYSYLGLDSHEDLIRAAAEAVLDNRSLNTSISRMRLHFGILKRAEDALSDLFDVEAVTLASCAAAAWSALPLVASGAFTEDVPPLMVFDKNAHFCLNAMKPSVADETEVVTIRHNDLEALEDLCRKHQKVAFVADGVYSTGGRAPVKELLALQEKYGLFLFFDEAHGISTLGTNGRGLVLEEMDGINDRTLLITSLNKGFGASGGAIFLGPRGSARRRDLALRYGGPLTWSQRINTAGLGAILASAALHRTSELEKLQQRLQEKVDLFDGLVPTASAGDGLPIRFIDIGSEEATVRIARDLLADGFYTSALFFPVIARGRAGLRIMLRANLDDADIERFGARLNELRGDERG
ncbi:8-amino-7-oxononanoate synthase [Actinomadura rubteroloni]|uniref:8-amino-7-oxononanoate synthase n=1 Tax=Actinomadura rubteroloni TaxID=1926885 RepID=A0A2P4UQW5_9ACTN|nr:aminotransferase class I/II-fold pyridoxal phosphate-dependent enzyme [Actinomadura rubteroloni]POM27442.1 8-amino-7-oxononanoate synthase [Actinomadura rubteroloni]